MNNYGGADMVKHIILWKLKDELAGDEKRAIMEKIKYEIENLEGKIPGLTKMNIIIDKLDSCVQGTEEWTKALRENRSHVLDLISKYPQLLTMMDSSGHKAITLGEDGVYRIADWA